MAENELQILIKGIFSRIKEKYGYTDEQALIYLKGYEDCAEEHQQSLEKRDKMLRDTVAELCEAKRLLKAAVEGYSFIGYITKDYACPSAISCSACPMDEGKQCRIWEHADEALALIGEDGDK